MVDTHHAHLRHCTDESPVPSAFAKCEGIERQHGERVLCNTLVRRKREGRLAALGLGIVLVVPGANCRVKFRRLIGRGAALFGGSMCSDKSGEVDGREAFGCLGALLVGVGKTRAFSLTYQRV